MSKTYNEIKFCRNAKTILVVYICLLSLTLQTVGYKKWSYYSFLKIQSYGQNIAPYYNIIEDYKIHLIK